MASKVAFWKYFFEQRREAKSQRLHAGHLPECAGLQLDLLRRKDETTGFAPVPAFISSLLLWNSGISYLS